MHICISYAEAKSVSVLILAFPNPPPPSSLFSNWIDSYRKIVNQL